ncbi:uncharacterized protein LOC124253887 [Haliotis rubra]|uniref:uncharacterized protein LOC124253887 n=1 Tax=Haliotis rubra TaxID=36100 RepID=UPI001EE4F98D|nr:uncharacterized protein LOC124253887 [Haliotis rubra]
MDANETETIDLVSTVGGSLLEWVRIAILPYILVCVYISIIVLGVSLNVTLIVMFRKWKHHKTPGNAFILQMALVDIAMCVFCFPLTTMAAISKTWPLPDVVCSVLGVASRWFYHLPFVFLSCCAVERTIKIRNKELYMRTFGKTTFVIFVSGITCTLTFGVAVLPVIPAEVLGEIMYNKITYQCELVQDSSHFIHNFDFVMSVAASAVTYFVCGVLIFRVRRKSVPIKPDDSLELETMTAEYPGTMGYLRSASSLSSNSTSLIAVSVIGGKRKTKRIDINIPRGLQKLQTKGEFVVEVLRDDSADADYHMVITYVITWVMVTLFTLIQPMLTYIEVYGAVPLWGGAHIIAIMVGSMSFCVKPIVYLSHNKYFRRQTECVLPTVLTKTVTKVKVTVSASVDKLERAVFRMNSTKPFKGSSGERNIRPASADSSDSRTGSDQILSRSSTDMTMFSMGMSRSSTKFSEDMHDRAGTVCEVTAY